MKSRSAKNKGQRFAKSIAEQIREKLFLSDRDVRVTPSGVNGPDIQLSDKAFKRFPFSVECKNQERLNIWGAIKQAEDEARDGIPIVLFKRNRSKEYVCMEFNHFLRYVHAVCQFSPEESPSETNEYPTCESPEQPSS